MSEQDERERVDSVSRIILAVPKLLFRTFMDPEIFLAWRVPDRTEGRLSRFEPRIGGDYEFTLRARGGETGARGIQEMTRVAGRFIDMVPDTKVVEEVQYGADAPGTAATITLTTLIEPGNGGTKVTLQATGMPPSIDARSHREMLAAALRRLSLLTD